MSRYLEHLKALLAEQPPPGELTKLTKGTSVSTVSGQETPNAGDELANWGGRIGGLTCPDGIAPERWERLRDGALRFASESAAEAVRLGWSLHELFATAEPFARVDLQGAAWFIGDATVTGVGAAAITLRTASGATQRIYRRSLQ
jgi:hypothetical protein